jgi:hypothetical protein
MTVLHFLPSHPPSVPVAGGGNHALPCERDLGLGGGGGADGTGQGSCPFDLQSFPELSLGLSGSRPASPGTAAGFQ